MKIGLQLQWPPIIKIPHQITAEASRKGSTTLSNLNKTESVYNTNPDEVLLTKGVPGYYGILSDPEVSSDFTQMLNLVMSGYQWKPGDSSIEGLRNADFVSTAISRLPGSPLTALRNQIFGNAFITGLSVIEPEWALKEFPDFGQVLTFSNLNVKPTQSFIDASPTGIIVDTNGKILGFKQSSSMGAKQVKREDVMYYAYRGNDNNRWGRSGFSEIFDAAVRKREIYQIYVVFMGTNASGIRIAEVSEEEADNPALMAEAQAVMNDLAPLQSLAVDPRWKLDIKIPPGAAGSHFQGMLDSQDLQIRKGILGDSAFSGQADSSGSYSSREVSQNNVQQMLRSIGIAYCEDIGEQIAPLLLNANGFTGPVPTLVPEAIKKGDGDPKEVIENLSKAGLLGRIEDTPLLELAKTIFLPLGISIDGLKEKDTKKQPASVVPSTPEDSEKPDGKIATPKPTATPEPNDAEEDPKEVAARQQAKFLEGTTAFGNAPAGRTRADIRRRDKEFKKLSQAGIEDIVETWKVVSGQVLVKLEKALFTPDGKAWKVKNTTQMKEAVEKSITFKSSDMRKSINGVMNKGWAMGAGHAEETIKVQAAGVAVSVQPRTISNTMAKAMLNNRTMVSINAKYAGITQDMYLLLENAVVGGQAPPAVVGPMRDLLEKNGYPPSRATTIVNTSLNWTYNESRMNVYRPLHDPTGAIPGSIVGYIFAIVDDTDTTDVCLGYANQAFRVDDPNLPQPPLHYNCRSQLIAVFAHEVPWTPRSEGAFVSLADSKKLSTMVKPGWGGIAA